MDDLPFQRSADDTVSFTLGASSVTVALKGATVISYIHDAQERLFVSSKADVSTRDPNAIRGGVPVCWPVFGPPPTDNSLYAKLKQHGFARTSVWTFDQDRSTESNQEVKAVFTLQPNDAIRSVWTLPFALTYTVHLLPYSLRLSLQVENPADAVASLPFQALLHAYFRLPEGVLPPQVLVSPLHNLAYNDKVTGEQKVNEGRKVVDVDGPKGEVDRVYFRAPDELTIAYKGRTEMVKVKKTNLPDAVLWNPGPEKGKTIKDMHENGVDSYICLEPGLTEPFQYLEAGQSWEGGMEISFA
ncbi:hypothetical protein BMF94_5727 [Rhodotorula taiwanensis]|uniref:Glucose-6-phosphate 1-epimerase n=1 Tax=Rhodotorula taiwanensis TaxID=741276 RepID=A0A2S5B3U8_9BASI|nr:hypothetical protein BMF94_5727 [Rhodotorula taiwanensis]